jgi:DNA invertase Pin-like site-specific DNA recombinase
MRCAIYARVSTTKQDYEETQLPDLRDYVHRWGWEHECIEFVEKLSGREGKRRPQLDKLMEAAQNGKIDVVVAWKLDRFGRSTLDTLNNIKLLTDYHVRFVCSTMPAIDTDDRSPMGRFILQIFAAVAELERSFILERTHRGQQAYRQQYKTGQIGTTKHSKSGKDLPVGRPRHMLDRHRLSQLRAARKSVREIAQTLDVPRSVVHRELRALKAVL